MATWKKLAAPYDENHYLVEMVGDQPTGVIYWRELQPGGGWKEYLMDEHEMLSDMLAGNVYLVGVESNRGLDRFFRYRVDEPAADLEQTYQRADSEYASGSPQQCGALTYTARAAIKALATLRAAFESDRPGIFGDEPTDVPNDYAETP